MTAPADQARRGPLSGFRVVDTSSFVSAPYATMILADLGADVIKVEPPGGDRIRRFGRQHGGVSPLWLNVNHGKSSVALDLKTRAGRLGLNELLETADVFVQNWRPGVAESLGIGYDDLRALYPRLVYLSLSGFGESGPRSSAPVFDGMLQATCGFASQEGGGHDPVVSRSLIADKTSGSFAAQAVLAALLQRAVSGRGVRVDVSMFDVLAYFDFPDLCQDYTFLDSGSNGELAGQIGLFATADGWIVVTPVTGKQIGRTLEAVGRPDWKDDLKKQLTPSRGIDLLYERIRPILRTRSTDEWEQSFLAHDVPAAKVLTIDEHFADPQTVHNALYREINTHAGRVRRVRYPACFDGEPLPDPGAAPAVPA